MYLLYARICVMSDFGLVRAEIGLNFKLHPDLRGTYINYCMVFFHRAKSNMPTNAATAGSSSGAGATSVVLDVTRLKRAMVHHTKKFAGYRYFTYLFFCCSNKKNFLIFFLFIFSVLFSLQSAGCPGISVRSTGGPAERTE